MEIINHQMNLELGMSGIWMALSGAGLDDELIKAPLRDQLSNQLSVPVYNALIKHMGYLVVSSDMVLVKR